VVVENQEILRIKLQLFYDRRPVVPIARPTSATPHEAWRFARE
jgi:hypothetical protein